MIIEDRNIESRLEVPKHMIISWNDGFKIEVKTTDNEVVISANKDGLLSLSQHFAALAEETPGSHIHYDEYNSLEKGSADLIIEKTE